MQLPGRISCGPPSEPVLTLLTLFSYAPNGNSEGDACSKILHTGLALFLIIPITVFVIFVTVIGFINPGTLLHITHTGHGTIILVLAILAFQIVISLPASVLLRVYFAVEMLPRGVMLINLMQVMSLTFLAGGLWWHWGMVAIAILQLIPYGLTVGLALYDLNRKFPQFQILSLGPRIFLSLVH